MHTEDTDSVSMSSDKDICCCSASVWCQVIAWLQIISGVLGIIMVGTLLGVVDTLYFPDGQNVTTTSGEARPGWNDLNNHFGVGVQVHMDFAGGLWKSIKGIMKAVLGVALAGCLIATLTGCLLLLGTTKEKVSCLWSWIIIESIVLILSFAAMVVQVVQIGFGFATPTLVSFPIYGFMIWVAHRRIRDIETARLENTEKGFTGRE